MASHHNKGGKKGSYVRIDWDIVRILAPLIRKIRRLRYSNELYPTFPLRHYTERRIAIYWIFPRNCTYHGTSIFGIELRHFRLITLFIFQYLYRSYFLWRVILLHVALLAPFHVPACRTTKTAASTPLLELEKKKSKRESYHTEPFMYECYHLHQL